MYADKEEGGRRGISREGDGTEKREFLVKMSTDREERFDLRRCVTAARSWHTLSGHSSTDRAPERDTR